MEYSPLGSSGVDVSRVCLGTMTWGRQNNQADADEQIDYALSSGINFIDTAEMYAIPPTAETYGTTETIIGDWISRHNERRKDFILATKIAGIGPKYIRDGAPITGEAIISSVDASLKRLQTDYIDLYQLHWPNRTTPHFGKHAVNQVKFSKTDGAAETAGMLDILQALNDCVKAGKIRFCGLSDDTPWGISQYIKLSEQYSLPRMVSIQNEFSLLQPKDWPFLIEQCVHEDIAYLPWSPLGGGVIAGKYLDGARPEGTRWGLPEIKGVFRDTPNTNSAVKRYMQVAADAGISPVAMALAWCDRVDGVTSTIIGATSMAQLKEDIAAFDITLSDDTHKAIRQVLKDFPITF